MFEEKVNYKNLNAKQQEIYNFQKASAIFADYGYTTVKLSDDWMGADFIAISFDGTRYLKIQLKGRLTFEKKYQDKDIFVCFNCKKEDKWYLYNHDELLKSFIKRFENTTSWNDKNGYSSKFLSKETKEFLKPYLIG